LQSAKTSQKRFEGFKQAMDEKTLFNKDLVFWGDFSIDSGYQMMMNALNKFKKIDAVFAGNDLIALGAINAIKEVGLKIPENISLIGFDDMFFSAYLNPPLTTVHIPFNEEGAIAAKLLLKKMNNPEDKNIERIILDTEIVIRESVKIINNINNL
jgi:LacI family transcriptional regulator